MLRALLALALPLCALLAPASHAERARPRPAPVLEPVTVVAPTLRFGALAWDLDRAGVARVLASMRFVREAQGSGEAAEWRGRAFERDARLATEYGSDGRLLAVTLRFAPDARGSALQRYEALAERVRRRHGAWTARVEPGRSVLREERTGTATRLRVSGERNAATMWTGADGAGAVVQLDDDGTLWLRYESPRWNDEASRGDDRAPDAPR